MPQSILMITAIDGAENCATVLSKQFGLAVEAVRSRREGAGGAPAARVCPHRR